MIILATDVIRSKVSAHSQVHVLAKLQFVNNESFNSIPIRQTQHKLLIASISWYNSSVIHIARNEISKTSQLQ